MFSTEKVLPFLTSRFVLIHKAVLKLKKKLQFYCIFRIIEMIVHCLCVAVIFLHITVQFKKLLVKNIRTAKFLVIFQFLQIDSFDFNNFFEN